MKLLLKSRWLTLGFIAPIVVNLIPTVSLATDIKSNIKSQFCRENCNTSLLEDQIESSECQSKLLKSSITPTSTLSYLIGGTRLHYVRLKTEISRWRLRRP